MPYLTLFRKNKVVGTYRIESDRISVGRSPDNTIAFANKNVSRYHFRIDNTADGYVLTDLNSLNGTMVNGKLVERTILTDGDEVSVDPFKVRFALHQPRPDAEPTLHGQKLSGQPPMDEDEETRSPDHGPETDSAEKSSTAHLDEQEAPNPSPEVSSSTSPPAEEQSTAEFSREHIGDYIKTVSELPISHLFDVTGKLRAEVSTFDDPPGAAYIAIEGYVDNTNSLDLQETIHRTIDEENVYIFIDLGQLKYMSSSAWTVLSEEAHALRNVGGALIVIGMSPDVDSFYRSLQFDKVIQSFTDPWKAVEFVSNIQEQRQTGKTTLQEQLDLHHKKTCAELPLPEKIHEAIGMYGPMSNSAMLKVLRSDAFGNTRIGLLKLIRTLRSMDLNSREKQTRFYRSR